MSFDPNDIFNPPSFNGRYDHHTSSFDHFTHHTQHHPEIKTGIDPAHYDSQHSRINEESARAATERTTQYVSRNLNFMPIIERLKRFFCRG